jgi:hypothetical protein
MLSPKPKLEEYNGTIFLEARRLNEEIKQHFAVFSKEKAIQFLKEHQEFWYFVHHLIMSNVWHEFDTEDSCLIDFHDNYSGLILKLEIYEGDIY